VWRGDIFADENGYLKFIENAPVRPKEFVDGLKLPGVLIRAGADGNFSVILPKTPKALEKWALHELPPKAKTVTAARIIVGGKDVGDTLPKEWRVDTTGTVSDLRPATADKKAGVLANKPTWVSAGDLTPQVGEILIGWETPVFGEEFADRWGIAAKVTWKTKLCFNVTKVTSLLDPMTRQGPYFDKADFVKIEAFVDEGTKVKGMTTTSSWPSRLSGYRVWDENGKFLLEKDRALWFSARHLFVHDANKMNRPWYLTTADAIGSNEPFTDVCGDAYELVGMQDVEIGMTLFVRKTPTRQWVFTLLHRKLWKDDVLSFTVKFEK
jgi:hypothetical protein